MVVIKKCIEINKKNLLKIYFHEKPPIDIEKSGGDVNAWTNNLKIKMRKTY